jgi:hypothetical protein
MNRPPFPVRRSLRSRRGGFTIAELLVAIVVNSIIVLAGVIMLRTIVRATGANMDRTLAGGEVQDISQVLEPLVQDVGTGLPVDSGFAPVGVEQGSSQAALNLFYRDTTEAIQTGYRCVAFRNTPTPGCMTVAVAPAVGRHLLLVSAQTGAVRLIQITGVTAVTGGFAATWDSSATVLGYPRAGRAVFGESGTQVIPVTRTRVAWSLGDRQVLVTEGMTRMTPGTPWVLGERVATFSPQLLYLGVTPAGMPTMTGASFANNITAIRIALTQDFTVRGVPKVNARTVTLTPLVLMQ